MKEIEPAVQRGHIATVRVFFGASVNVTGMRAYRDNGAQVSRAMRRPHSKEVGAHPSSSFSDCCRRCGFRDRNFKPSCTDVELCSSCLCRSTAISQVRLWSVLLTIIDRSNCRLIHIEGEALKSDARLPHSSLPFPTARTHPRPPEPPALPSNAVQTCPWHYCSSCSHGPSAAVSESLGFQLK